MMQKHNAEYSTFDACPGHGRFWKDVPGGKVVFFHFLHVARIK